MSNAILVNDKKLQVKEFKGKRVVTFKEIDFVHGRAEGTAKRNFSDNKKYFVENVDYFEVSTKIVPSLELYGFSKFAPNGILITESGYLMLVKSLTDDLAWTVQRELINNYFRVKREEFSLPTTYKEALEHILARIKENEKLQIENEEMKPKAIYHDKVLNPEKLVTTTDIAKDLGMTAQALNTLLYTNKIIYPVKKNGRVKCWKPYREYQWMIPEYADFKISECDTQLKWTEIGRKWLIEFVKKIKKIS
ncbi:MULTISPECIES: phage antirepressor KilAC domain-containing protein [unclassified Clostridioides]|uniref:phage antirepressor KilAC domain-containing protein n=1 Tax=unclassified Clostridioides TaxID=2635829 RepID=UPI001D0FAD96|nr:phage antirepressor KilAC domain-containing protein [Clostridioides sp. ES-W-0018-02]MCC0705134.1 phage antirepressor KilAC domain-containing protein [Clostridioides sp. ES-S-0049-02]MCC0713035.1 phage antirepressor KilAC domain-containing protein [Clostridioides sp. ES-W-0017-02]